MIRPARFALRATLGLLAALLAFVPAAGAHQSRSGGASAPVAPKLKTVECGTEKTATCGEGELLRIRGEYLEAAQRVVFRGAAGREDDRAVRPRERSLHRVVVRIPSAAPTGRVRVFSTGGASPAGPRVQVVPKPAPKAATPAEPGAFAFPVRGAYDYGTDVNRFGAPSGRGHKGQDVFAKCGTPLVAALNGKVTMAKWHDAAGNYVVIEADDGTSQAYMHMQSAPTVTRGQRVKAGQPLGRVGETGRASGCHLHFELWTAPGWYQGGQPTDPLPTLKRWARAENR